MDAAQDISNAVALQVKVAFCLNDLSNNPRLLAKDGGGMRLTVNSNGSVTFSDGTDSVTNAAGSVSRNTAHEVIAQWTTTGGAGSGQLFVSVDGAFPTIANRTSLTALLNHLYIGGYDSGTTEINGEVWDVRVYEGGTLTHRWKLLDRDLTDSVGSDDLTLVKVRNPAGVWKSATDYYPTLVASP